MADDPYKYDAGDDTPKENDAGDYTPKGHYEEQKDPEAQAQIAANKMIIEQYESLSTQIDTLKSAVLECKQGLDCCYENATLATTGLDFGSIIEYSESMDTQAENLETYKTNITEQIDTLTKENAALDLKTVLVWVPD